jgi:hypothetical protein
VLLARTRLAYVHLRNLLTDAKRDRAARVFGYVAVWLPEEVLLLYLQEGEVVAATSSKDGVAFVDVPIRGALARVPSAAEYGEICFHEADDEQLACMHAAQVLSPDPLPPEVRLNQPAALLAHLLAATYDGVLEINAGGRLNYIVLRHGSPRRAYFAEDNGASAIDTAICDLWQPGSAIPVVRRWPVPPPLQVQAAPALIDAYRALMRGLNDRFTHLGVRNASQLIERARQALVAAHPALEQMELAAASGPDPVTTAPKLARAVAAWSSDVLMAVALPDAVSAEEILRDLTRERRHLFQSAGFFDALKWKVA